MTTHASRTTALSALTLALAAGTAAAQQTETVAPGYWFDASTWSNGVPDDVIDASVLFDVFVGGNIEALSFQIGVAMETWEFGRVESPGEVLVGVNGSAGSLYCDSAVLVDSLVIGASAPGFVRTVGRLETSRAAGTGPDAFRIGADGFPGMLVLGRSTGSASAGGFTLGSQGTVLFNADFSSGDTAAIFDITGGNLTFAPGSTLDLTLAGFNSVEVGDRFGLFNYSGSRAGLPTLVMPAGYTGSLQEPVAGRLELVLHSIPSEVAWTGGDASYFTDANWSNGSTPSSGGEVTIDNGSVVLADGTQPSTPSSIAVNELTLGGLPGDGALTVRGLTEFSVAGGGELNVTPFGPGGRGPGAGNFEIESSLTVEDVGFLTVTGDLGIGRSAVTDNASIITEGTLLLDRVGELFVDGDIEVGEASARDALTGQTSSSTSLAEARGVAVFRDMDRIETVRDLNIADGEASLFNAPGVATAVHDASVLFEDVGRVIVGNGLLMAQVDGAERETEIVRADVMIRDVEDFTVGGDLRFITADASGLGDDAGVADVIASVTIENSNLRAFDDIEVVNGIRIGDDALLNASIDITMTDSTWSLYGDGNFNYGRVFFTIGSTLPGDAASSVDGNISLLRSTIDVEEELVMGFRSSGHTAALSAVIDLQDGSTMEAGFLELDELGEIHFNLTSLTRADGSRSAGAYPAVNLNAYDDEPTQGAELVGTISAEFDFAPPAGMHTFDLVVDNDGREIIGAPTLQVTDLPLGFTVDSFGLVSVNGTNDVLRLVISSAPVVDPCPTDTNGDGVTDLADLLTVLANFGTISGATQADGDTDGDGAVLLNDLLAVLAEFGNGCS